MQCPSLIQYDKRKVMFKAVPSRITWRRPLMVRQPYSVASYILSFLRFLSPTRETEGVVKTIQERLGEKGGALLAGETER